MAPMISKSTLPLTSSSCVPSQDEEVLVKQGSGGHASGNILAVIDSLKRHVTAERVLLIKTKFEENKERLQTVTNHLYDVSNHRTGSTGGCMVKQGDLLAKRQGDAVGMLNGSNIIDGEHGNSTCHEDNMTISSAVLLGSYSGGKDVIRPIKLHDVQKLPPYTTWIFLDRNQRMTEDQSVVGRRRIYYDQSGGEALICSDSEEEVMEEDEEKKEFSEAEDYIIRMTIHKVGLCDIVLDLLAKSFERTPCDIKAWYDSHLKRAKSEHLESTTVPAEDIFANKDLDAALDSFDNLFCRRCLAFDCRLHGCSQELVFPAEKQPSWNCLDEEKGMLCGIHCYRAASPGKTTANFSISRKAKSHQSESASSNIKGVSESSESEMMPCHLSSSKTSRNAKFGSCKRNCKKDREKVSLLMRKQQKKRAASDSDSVASETPVCSNDIKLSSNNKSTSPYGQTFSFVTRKSRRKESEQCHIQNPGIVLRKKELVDGVARLPGVDKHCSVQKEFSDENLGRENVPNPDKQWRTIEKGLFLKGVEIFGKNSCLIARNLLNGMKTCTEVFQYMNFTDTKMLSRTNDIAESLLAGSARVNCNDSAGGELRARSRFVRRRGRVRRLKYTWKSAGCHSARKRISERKDQPCRQYTSCGCQSVCSKQCTCLLNGTCCEKYCGCPKSCKNRFRGCHCAKSQCRSRQCPCFAADRECDPDVCRNCWVGCGDGTLGAPSQRGDNYECRNMKLLLKQQQRVLLGKSDVSGWGAFLKNSVNKHDYLGEYTGELISHHEADKRGKIYDRENSSFLFNLNDQFVLDAYRKGDKLKFANHSPDPNCYAKVLSLSLSTVTQKLSLSL